MYHFIRIQSIYSLPKFTYLKFRQATPDDYMKYSFIERRSDDRQRFGRLGQAAQRLVDDIRQCLGQDERSGERQERRGRAEARHRPGSFAARTSEESRPNGWKTRLNGGCARNVSLDGSEKPSGDALSAAPRRHGGPVDRRVNRLAGPQR